MSTDGLKLTLRVTHGRQAYSVQLDPTDTVRQLCDQLEQLTGVLARQQKLIHKSKVLQPSSPLKDTSLKSGDSILLLGAGGQTQARVNLCHSAEP